MGQSIHYMVGKLFMKIQQVSKIGLTGYNMTPSQVRILMYIGQRIHNGEVVFQKDIEREFNIKGSSVTSALNNLEKNKWIRRESVDYDARLRSIVFDEKSYAVLKYMTDLSEQFDDLMRESLTEAEFIVFCQCIEKMIAAIDENKDMFSGRDFERLIKGEE